MHGRISSWAHPAGSAAALGDLPRRLLLLYGCALILMASPTRGANRVVLFEAFSATWCQPCWQASHALESVIDTNPDAFILVDSFIGGSSRYTTSYGNNRAQFDYEVTSIPTVWLDGVDVLIGAQTSGSYEQAILNRAAAPADVTVDIQIEPTSTARQYTVTTTVGVEPGGAPRQLRVNVLEVLDHYGVFDDGVTTPRNVVRQAVVDGAVLSVSAGDTAQVTGLVTFDAASWDKKEDIRLVAWAEIDQPAGPRLVHNATQLQPFAGLPGDYNGDGFVDAADYTVWRDNLGAVDESPIMHNGDGGGVSLADYQRWRANYGAGASSVVAGVRATVPGPSALSLCLLVCLASLAFAEQRRAAA